MFNSECSGHFVSMTWQTPYRWSAMNAVKRLILAILSSLLSSTPLIPSFQVHLDTRTRRDGRLILIKFVSTNYGKMESRRKRKNYYTSDFEGKKQVGQRLVTTESEHFLKARKHKIRRSNEPRRASKTAEIEKKVFQIVSNTENFYWKLTQMLWCQSILIINRR